VSNTFAQAADCFLRKPQPVLTGASALTYYNLVEQLQAHHGQETLIGKRLGALTAGVSGARTTLVLQEFPWPQRSWRGATRDESGNLEVRSVHAGNHGLSALEDLEAELNAIAATTDFPGADA